MTAIEALANTIIGGIISWAVTWALLGYTPAQSVAVTLMFAAMSFARSYVLRRAFAWWQA